VQSKGLRGPAPRSYNGVGKLTGGDYRRGWGAMLEEPWSEWFLQHARKSYCEQLSFADKH
jgi:hypothetical protein